MHRRLFLTRSAAALAGIPLLSGGFVVHGKDTNGELGTPSVTDRTLTPRPGEVSLVGPDFPATAVWGFDGQVPGPGLRVKRGQSLRIDVTNALPQPTSVHWHGIRLPNAMDGVAGLTQAPIAPGDTFAYRFSPPDAGTYWYHSHVNAYEQVGRGLYGPLIVEEEDAPVVDRELVWMIDDWRLLEDASISEDFGNGHDRSHAGRLGNVPTVNGRFRDVVKVRPGERVRLRLINASNARNFALDFADLPATLIAIDGQPATPRPVSQADPVILGAAGRCDVILDMMGQPGTRKAVTDRFYNEGFDLIALAFDGEPLRESPLAHDVALPAAGLPEPDLREAVSQDVTIAGGAMGGLRRAMLDGEWLGLREIAQQGYVWAINDTVGNRIDMPPLVSVPRGTTVRLRLENRSAFPHPMHLHGHHMKLLSIDGEALTSPRWVDSPLLFPRQRMELAFVADNPGRWLFHCHALEHHAAGLGTLVEVTG